MKFFFINVCILSITTFLFKCNTIKINVAGRLNKETCIEKYIVWTVIVKKINNYNRTMKSRIKFQPEEMQY